MSVLTVIDQRNCSTFGKPLPMRQHGLLPAVFIPTASPFGLLFRKPFGPTMLVNFSVDGIDPYSGKAAYLDPSKGMTIRPNTPWTIAHWMYDKTYEPFRFCGRRQHRLIEKLPEFGASGFIQAAVYDSTESKPEIYHLHYFVVIRKSVRRLNHGSRPRTQQDSPQFASTHAS